MRITIITSPFGELPPVAIGAVEKLFYILAGEWIKLGHKVSFVCCGGGDNPEIDFIRIKKYNRTGSTKKDIFWDLLYSIKALWRCPKTDILLCNTFWTPALAPLFRWKYNRLVYGVHRFPKRQFWLYPFVHSFICVSRVVAEALKKQLITKRDVRVINNPIDIDVFNRHVHADKDSALFTIVYSGRVHPEKGLDILFSAAESIARKYTSKRIKLKIIGTAELSKGGGGVSYVDNLIKLAPNVSIDWVDAIRDPKELAKSIKVGDCFVYPSVASKGETFGVAPLEAMALGMPTILSNLPCFTDFASFGNNCLSFELGDESVVNLSRQIVHVMENRDEAMNMAERSIATANSFSSYKIADEYLESFRSILIGEQ